MKYRIIILFSFLLFLTSVNAQRKTINGVQYEVQADNLAKASLTIAAKGEVVIPETIEIGKKEYAVTSMGKAYFGKNTRITSITLPATLISIQTQAFDGCVNLEKLVLPTGFYTIEKDAFLGCNSLNDIQGNTTPFLEYKNKNGGTATALNLRKRVVPNFSIYANDKLRQRMELWQTKKDYETIDQYKKRVTEEKRRQRMDEFAEELKVEYASLYAPSIVITMLSNYDSEYEVFTVQTDFYGNIYMKVPKDDARNFRAQFGKAEKKPQFSVQGDTLAITAMQIVVNGKTYDNVNNYAGGSGKDATFELPPLDIDLTLANGEGTDNEIDQNIPKNKTDNLKRFAVIIGNEQYQDKQVAIVDYARNDARVFAEYCKKTLGMPIQNIRLYENATYGTMLSAMSDIQNIAEAYEGEASIIFYYAGHGVPNEKTHDAFLLPVDMNGRQTEGCYPLNRLYKELGNLNAKSVVVFLDACFSGSQRGDGMIAAARGVAIKSKSETPQGKMVVFSAAQGDETAYPYKATSHGLFTYFILKKLQESKGECTLGELGDYVQTNVRQQAVTINRKSQTPSVSSSASMSDTWRKLKLR